MIKLQVKDQEHFDLLEKICVEGRQVFYLVGSALGEIKERKWYLSKGFSTFADYADSIGYSKRHADQMILDSKTVEQLPDDLRNMITTERAAKELARVPEGLRPVIIKSIKDKGGKATAEEIKNSKPPPPRKKPGPPPREGSENVSGGSESGLSDRTGLPVPQEIAQLWTRASGPDVRGLITYVEATISQFTKMFDGKDLIFVEVDCTANVALLKQVKKDLERAVPYAVCPTCQGKLPKGCLLCKEKGYVSEFLWKSPAITEEIRKMRKIKKT